MAKRVILQVDGGGILGITPAIVLHRLETDLRAKHGNNHFLLRDMLTLCCGTSTGAIMAGFVAAGVDAANIDKFYSIDGVDLFNNSKNPIYTRFLKPKFQRQPFINKLNAILQSFSASQNANVTLGQLPNTLRLMTTAYNLSSHRTHFIKSYDPHDQSIQLADAIAWSALSAAYYFGKINVPNYTWTRLDNSTPPNSYPEAGASFQDGGQGTQNCTLDFVLAEILAQGWEHDDVVIISLGTGSKTKFTPYSQSKDISDIGQAIKFIANQARDESTTVQEMAARYICKKLPNIQLFRLDYESPEDYDLDDTDHVDVYKKGAQQIIASSEYGNLVGLL
ncbi:patatin-like phospholipase family protein [Methylomonas sp. MS20]|uniref:patatin-like phospholipase family protein n=1 Tax=unclassified Methylomonas TaxID=2608980 RepID=UPI0028A47110|nr:patatin-like phospholipase family protein [Methylomonas sp. MV1]MDT4331196.1 patatin-like phospholipase family protein [Methylomonas sp. MV1]